MSIKNKFNKVLSGFSNEEKVFLYNFLYEELSGKGICGDTELAHVNKHEMAVLRSMGGAGTINENTKCVQFFGSPPPPPPVTTTSKQSAEIPAELKPYVKEVLSEAQDIYRTRKEEGYVPYTGQEIAEFSPEQERAFDLTSQAVGQTQAFATPAAQFAGLAGLGTTDADISRFMNPYVSQVVERAERERRRAGDIEQQELAAKAVQAGAFGGSREAILEAERRRNLEQGIADIRTAGLSEAFKQAVQQAQSQQENRLGAARSLTELAQVAPRGTADELARLEAVGAARRGQSQADLDISRRKFIEEKTFPETALAGYQSFVAPTLGSIGPSKSITDIGPGQAQPTYLQQTAGFLGSLGSLAGGFKDGGKVGGSSGLASLQAGGQIPDEEEETTEQADPFTEEELAALAEAQPGFFETAGDTISSGISSAYDFLTERPKENLLSGPTRLQNISDFLIGYSQADPSKPLGTQFGQAAASMSAKQAKQRQQRLENILAKQLLGVKARKAGIEAAKAKDISTSTLNSLSGQINDLLTNRVSGKKRNIAIANIENLIEGKIGPNVNRVKFALKRTGLLTTKPASTGGNRDTVLDKTKPGSKASLLRIDQSPLQPTKEPE